MLISQYFVEFLQQLFFNLFLLLVFILWFFCFAFQPSLYLLTQICLKIIILRFTFTYIFAYQIVGLLGNLMTFNRFWLHWGFFPSERFLHRWSFWRWWFDIRLNNNCRFFNLKIFWGDCILIYDILWLWLLWLFFRLNCFIFLWLFESSILNRDWWFYNSRSWFAIWRRRDCRTSSRWRWRIFSFYFFLTWNNLLISLFSLLLG